METARSSNPKDLPDEPELQATPPRPRRRLPMALITWAFVLLVLLIVIVLLVLKVTQGSTTVAAPPVSPASQDVVRSATSVPASAFNQAGAPASQEPQPEVLSGQPRLVLNGDPAVVFIGGEFCPYCAAARWALVVALGRFGTFSKLGATSSSNYEVFPGTATFSFDGASYHSRYVTLSATEQYGQAPSTRVPAGFPELRSLSPLDQFLVKEYGDTSFTSDPGGGSTTTLPFVDVDNRLVISGAAVGFSPSLLQGSSLGKIAGNLSHPADPVSAAILGEANLLSAAICSATGEQPAAVCDSSGVHAGDSRLGLR
jgi:Domain of unknown function (DUF929)